MKIRISNDEYYKHKLEKEDNDPEKSHWNEANDPEWPFNFRQRQTDIVCADYFKVVIFWKKQFVKNGNFTDFRFLESKNWFVIHKSQTLRSNSAIVS